MRNTLFILSKNVWAYAAACLLSVATGCKTHDRSSTQPPSPPTVASIQPVATPLPTSVQQSAPAVVRIKAGLSNPFTDSNGNVWQPDQGFDGGDVIDRDAGTVITNTKDPGIFLTEHYGMSSFSRSLPNGKYLAKLYFAETFDGITEAGQRVFSFNVQGREFKDFDVWGRAGGANKAYIETIPVEITNGKFQITFTSNVENPEINAIEIAPQK